MAKARTTQSCHLNNIHGLHGYRRRGPRARGGRLLLIVVVVVVVVVVIIIILVVAATEVVV